MIDIAKVMQKYYPDAVFTCGETYDSLTMLDATPKPSQADLDAKWLDYLATKRRTRKLADIQANVETWLNSATAAQKTRALALSLTLGCAYSGNLDLLKNLTQIDPTEPDT